MLLYVCCVKDILDPDKFWGKELMRANKDLLFSCFIDPPKGVTALQDFVKGCHSFVSNYTGCLP
jgi:hypothetical protein